MHLWTAVFFALSFALTVSAEPVGFKVTGVEVAYIHTKQDSGLGDWYRDNLGFDLQPQFGDKTWLQTDFTNKSSRFAVDLRGGRGGMENQPVVLSFSVDNLESAVKHMQSMGVKFLNPSAPIDRASWGLSTTFQDKDGNWMQLTQKY